MENSSRSNGIRGSNLGLELEFGLILMKGSINS